MVCSFLGHPKKTNKPEAQRTQLLQKESLKLSQVSLMKVQKYGSLKAIVFLPLGRSVKFKLLLVRQEHPLFRSQTQQLLSNFYVEMLLYRMFS